MGSSSVFERGERRPAGQEGGWGELIYLASIKGRRRGVVRKSLFCEDEGWGMRIGDGGVGGGNWQWQQKNSSVKITSASVIDTFRGGIC